MSTYDPTKHSTNKMGLAIHALIVPDVPTGAQVSLESGIMHVQVLGGLYLGVYKPVACLLPEDWKPAVEAMPTLPDEDSYSGSGSVYKRLHVQGGDSDPNKWTIRTHADGPVLARVYVDASVPVASGDEHPITGAKLPMALGHAWENKAAGLAQIPGISLGDPDPDPAVDPTADPTMDPDPTGPVDVPGEDPQDNG